MKAGLSDYGRLQKYLNEHLAKKIQKVVPQHLLKEFLGANNLTEQKRLFQQFPLKEINAILRYIQMIFLFHVSYSCYAFLRYVLINQVSWRSEAQLKYAKLTPDEMVDMVWKNFCSVSQDIPIADNFYYSLFVTGTRSVSKPTPQYSLPPYLTKNGFDSLKVSTCVSGGPRKLGRRERDVVMF